MRTRLTVLGDSFVQGYGDEPLPDGRYRGWAVRFAELLGVRGARLCNLGSYGATTQDVVDRQLGPALVGKAPMIGLMAGVNDLISDYDPDRFRHNIERILGTITGPNTTVFTATYPVVPRIAALPGTFRDLVSARFAEASEVLWAAVERHGVLCLDMAQAPEWRRPELWSDDGLHPSPAGHRHFADGMAELVGSAAGMTVHTGRWAG
jgi:lysophospholipase L1-like esterase